jgi:hypothetical protein
LKGRDNFPANVQDSALLKTFEMFKARMEAPDDDDDPAPMVAPATPVPGSDTAVVLNPREQSFEIAYELYLDALDARPKDEGLRRDLERLVLLTYERCGAPQEEPPVSLRGFGEEGDALAGALAYAHHRWPKKLGFSRLNRYRRLYLPKKPPAAAKPASTATGGEGPGQAMQEDLGDMPPPSRESSLGAAADDEMDVDERPPQSELGRGEASRPLTQNPSAGAPKRKRPEASSPDLRLACECVVDYELRTRQ